MARDGEARGRDNGRMPTATRRATPVVTGALALAATLALGACGGREKANPGSAPGPGIPAAPAAGATAATAVTADGRLPLAELQARHDALATAHGWQAATVYAYPDDPALAIRAYRSPQPGPALWLLAGIHGEEPAGPNAIAARVPALAALAARGVPMVVLPLANPKAYRANWRYPNTPERDWRGGGYSVGDSEWLLPDLETGTRPRAAAAPGPETAALTAWALATAADYPPVIVIDLHEDELSVEGGYIYSQGTRPETAPAGAAVLRALQSAGMPLRLDGRTRFGEPIVAGVAAGDEAGAPIYDGSIDELLGANAVFRDGERRPGPGAGRVIVVETPAFAGSRLAERVAAQAAVIDALEGIWALASGTPPAQ